MTTQFKVGDTICVSNPRIKSNVILEIEWERYSNRYKYIIEDNSTYILSSNTVIAKSKEELIDLLYPVKIGPFDYNQLVYVIETNGSSIGINVNNSLVIDRGYVKALRGNQFLIGANKDSNKDIVPYDFTSIHTLIDKAKQIINKWLNSNDN